MARAARPGSAYLDEVLAAMWPQGAEVAGRGPARARAQYVAVPDARRARLLVPRRPRRVAAAALQNYTTTRSRRTAVALRVAGLAVRLGAADLLPDRIGVGAQLSDAQPSDAQPSDAGSMHPDVVTHLRTCLGRDLDVSLYIGPARAAQKPVLQLLTPAGRTFAFAKLGVSEISRPLVRHEGATLAELGSRAWQRLGVPAVLHCGSWRGHEVLVQQAFGRDGAREVPPATLTAAMVELADVRGRTTTRLVDSPFWHALRGRLAGLAPGPHAAALRAAADRVGAHRADEPLTLGCWHGDWAPWNMLATAERVLVWDWETFGEGLPMGFDRVHHDVQRAVVLANVPPAEAYAATARTAPHDLAPFGVAPAAARLVVLLYLLHLATGHLEQDERHVRLARLDEWLAVGLAPLVASVVADAG
jgi:hypothetical protein